MLTKTDIEKYFNGEKRENSLFMSIGISGVVFAIIFFFFINTEFYKGIAIPLLVIGSLLGIVGYIVYRRSDTDRMRIISVYESNSTELKEKEVPRMKIVMKSFIIYRWIEIVLLFTGIALYIYFVRDIRHDFWRGLGLGLAVMSLIALIADSFAEKRGHIYLDGLLSFTSKNS